MISWKIKTRSELIEEAISLEKISRAKKPKQDIHTTLSSDIYKIMNRLMNRYNIKNRNEIIEIALFYMDLVKRNRPND